jgi:predicted MFS family arabinose efflux permease
MPVRLLYAQYAAVAVGLVPAAVFLVDFIARALAYGPIRGAWFWTLYGVGAMLGPPLFGLAADRIGFRRALGGGLLLSAVAAAGLAWLPSTPVLVLASLLLGAFTPGVVTLMIGRLHELLADDHAAQHAAWSRLTTIFALFQALSGYAFSWLYTVSRGDYRLLYAAAAAAFALALTIDLVPSRLVRRSGA